MMYTLINVLHNLKPRCLLRRMRGSARRSDTPTASETFGTFPLDRMAIRGTCALLEVRDFVRLEVTFGVPSVMQKRRTEQRRTQLERSCDVQIGQDKHLSASLFRARSQECSSEVVRHGCSTDQHTNGTGTFPPRTLFKTPNGR